jgi:hypothetical protein
MYVGAATGAAPGYKAKVQTDLCRALRVCISLYLNVLLHACVLMHLHALFHCALCIHIYVFACADVCALSCA